MKKKIKTFAFLTLIAMCGSAITANSEEIMVRASSGEYVAIDLDSDAPFREGIKQIEVLLENSERTDTTIQQGYVLDFTCGRPQEALAHIGGRDYYRAVTKSELSDMRYIITKLAS